MVTSKKALLFQAGIGFTAVCIPAIFMFTWLLQKFGEHPEFVPKISETILTTYFPGLLIVVGVVFFKLRKAQVSAKWVWLFSIFGGLFYASFSILWKYFIEFN